MQIGDTLLIIVMISLLMFRNVEFISNDALIISTTIALVGFYILDAIVGIGKTLENIQDGSQ